MNLFLVPGHKKNFKATLDKRVSFSLSEKMLPEDTNQKIRDVVKDSSGFHCWAMTPNSATFFSKMQIGDIVLFKPNGSDYIEYKGKVALKFKNKDFGGHVWSEGENWECVYVLKEMKSIKINFQYFSIKIGRKDEYIKKKEKELREGRIEEIPEYIARIFGTHAVKDESLISIQQKYGGIDSFLSSLEDNSGIIEETQTSQILKPESQRLKILKHRFKELISKVNDLKEREGSEKDNENLVAKFYETLGYESPNEIKFRPGHVDILIENEEGPYIVNEIKQNWGLNRKTQNGMKAVKQGFGYALENGASLIVITNSDYFAIYDRTQPGTRIDQYFAHEFHLSKLKEEDCRVIEEILGKSE